MTYRFEYSDGSYRDYEVASERAADIIAWKDGDHVIRYYEVSEANE